MNCLHSMKEDLTDSEIVEGLRAYDAEITKKYFYGYCKVAYGVYARKYALYDKPDMDFYSLAHEYYLYLVKREWQPLIDRSAAMSLKMWMTNGFRFLILDKLKEFEKKKSVMSVLDGADVRRIAFNVVDADYKEEVRKMVDAVCTSTFGRNSVSATIMQMMLVDGYKGREVAEKLGITPSAVSQRYHHIMETVVKPYFKEYYEVLPEADYTTSGLYYSLSLEWKNMGKDMQERTTPWCVESLAENEIFVFGSNLAGMHSGGAARQALIKFGAVWGQGVGLQGQSYALPTMQGGVETIAPYVDEFVEFAKAHSELKFLVTPIGCGIAGFSPRDIAPLFREAVDVENVCLPGSFWECLCEGGEE